MSLFRNKYRVESIRMRNWDYSWPGLYFITICTGGREHYFGEISNRRMHLNQTGDLAQTIWMEIPIHFPFIVLDAFIVMPNHIHGIIIIEKPDLTRLTDITRHTDMPRLTVETRLIASLPPPPPSSSPSSSPSSPSSPPLPSSPSPPPPPNQRGGFAGNKNPMLNDNLSRVLRWYKGRVSFESRKIDANFEWQERFHDHVIRDEQSYRNIRRYIISNPERWEEDGFNHKLTK